MGHARRASSTAEVLELSGRETASAGLHDDTLGRLETSRTAAPEPRAPARASGRASKPPARVRLLGERSLIQPPNRADHRAMYDPELVQPMRDEVTRLGVKELKTPTDVDAALKQPGTALVFVNSVCGCAAGGARPGLRLALQMAAKKPTNLYTVFAGMEREATEKARSYFAPYRPSSPQIALLKDGKLVTMIQRHDIEGQEPANLAKLLTAAFEQHC